MTHLIDTNVVVDLTSRRGVAVRPRLEVSGLKSLAISAISLAELEYGEAKTGRPSRSLATFREFLLEIPILSFDEGAVEIYGRIRADLERRGQIIGTNDLLIAATALAHNLTVVPRDIGEFGRVIGLRVEDWSK